MPVETPTSDYYGGQRPGNNLFAESLVCVDLKTGQRKWHFQLSHHPIWDYDISSAPILADLNVDGKPIKAVIQPTKQCWLFVFDRVTGQPVWPIVERPAPQGDVASEWYSPTQPFPTKPPAHDRQGVSLDDLIDYTPELHAEAVKIASQFRLGPIYTPPVESKAGGPLATLTLPSPAGGTNWPGAAYDPETHIVYASSQTVISAARSGSSARQGILGHGLHHGPRRSNISSARPRAQRRLRRRRRATAAASGAAASWDPG